MGAIFWGAAVCLLAFGGSIDAKAQKRDNSMNQQTMRACLATARDSNRELSARIQALEQLAGEHDPSFAGLLRELWSRPLPPFTDRPKNWDPEAAERVVNLYVILALHNSGDSSLLPQIAFLVGHAGDVLDGPYSERKNAAKVIREIGRPEPIQDLVALAGQPGAAPNAIRTLQLLDLPEPPTGGPVNAVPELNTPLAITIRRLRQELETVESHSNGRITLSPGVRETMVRQDYDRGEVHRQTTFSDFLTKDLDSLNFTYAVAPRSIIICTFQEAASRWQQQWPAYSKRLLYNSAAKRWRLGTA